MTKLNEKSSFPLKRIEQLIKLANEHNLEKLTVGKIEIIPRQGTNRVIEDDVMPEQDPAPNGGVATSILEVVRNRKGKDGRELTPQQVDDFLLFGSTIEEQ